jgi:hypothetical protein
LAATPRRSINTFAVGDDTLTIDTLAVDGSTRTVDDSTLTSIDDTQIVDGNTLAVGDGTLTSDGQHRLSGTIASMTRW